MNGKQGTMILDGTGRIRGCGTAASQLFGANFADLSGKVISTLIGELEISTTAHSFDARRLAYLCASQDWRRFDAVDLRGQRFAVELTVAQMRTQDGIDLFLLSLRRPETVSA